MLFLPPNDVKYLAEMALERLARQELNLERIRKGEKQGDMVGITDKILNAVAEERPQGKSGAGGEGFRPDSAPSTVAARSSFDASEGGAAGEIKSQRPIQPET
jgi:hypothetical protein